jgi:hypothetical protein
LEVIASGALQPSLLPPGGGVRAKIWHSCDRHVRRSPFSVLQSKQAFLNENILADMGFAD